jgi:hypothetical protein
VRPEHHIRRLLDDVAGRLRIVGAARAVAAGAAVAAVVGLLPVWPSAQARALVMVLVVAGVSSLARWRLRATLTRGRAAEVIEQYEPGLLNIVITAEELDAHPERASDWMRERVASEATDRTRGIEPGAVVRLSSALALMSMALVAAVAVVALTPSRTQPVAVSTTTDADAAADDVAPGAARLHVRIEPPAHTRLSSRDEVDPERLEVVEGTRVRIRVAEAAAVPLRVRVGSQVLNAIRSEGAVTAEAILTESGYLAIEPESGDERGTRRLLPVQVTPDRTPVVRIENPGRDLLLPPGTATIPIAVVAQDDFGLEMLELRYTKVSGSGEQFEFEEGTLRARVTKGSVREWRAEAELPVETLDLGPGDSVVYCAFARDARPGDRGTASSDTFFVEIQGRGQVLLEGLEMPPEQERYALSQQMVVMKIERLRARERSMPRQAVAEEAALIAAEQRSVRANFIFLMGGHVEDEVEEAEHSHEIQEGRLENSARKEISAAIHYMTAAGQGLTAVDTAQALPPARAAVEALQRAFGRNRYILRSLAVQSRIDQGRRLTGSLDAASTWRRDSEDATEDPAGLAMRSILAGLLDASARVEEDRTIDGAGLAGLAERALAVGPDSAEWQQVATAIFAMRGAVEAGEGRESLRARLRAALDPVVREVQRRARPPAAPGTTAPGALERGWASEVRR